MEDVGEVGVGFEGRFDGGGGLVDGVVVGGDLSWVGDFDGGGGGDSCEVVSHEVDDHVEFGAVFGVVVEVDWVCGGGACAFHWLGGEGV